MLSSKKRAFRPQTILFGLLLLSAAALLAISPKRYAGACAEGIALWATAVLPALFPFLVLSSLLAGPGSKLADRLSPLMRKLRLPAAAAVCFFLSLLCGYPVGSRTLRDLSEQGSIPREGVLRTAVLCSTSGPMFLLGTVGGALYGSAAAGAVLFASHLLGVLAVCLLLMPFAKRLPPSSPPRRRGRATLYDSVHSAVISVLCFGGFIALFYVLGQMLTDIGALRPFEAFFSRILRPFGGEALAEGAVYGLIEATHGCASLAAAGGRLALPLTAFIVTFGGGSILAQQLAFLTPIGVKAPLFIGIKALQGTAAFFICLALSSLL